VWPFRKPQRGAPNDAPVEHLFNLAAGSITDAMRKIGEMQNNVLMSVFLMLTI
jgi:hypothetical protein